MAFLSDVEIINLYSQGQRSDITVCENHFFMPVRISGVGKTLRFDEKRSREEISKVLLDSHITVDNSMSFQDLVNLYKENSQKDIQDLLRFSIVDRDSQNFTNKQVLEALQGLPIIKEHPNNGELLTYGNLKDNPIIGTILKTYLNENNEIWGLAKIYDLSLLDDLDRLQSTSPAVISTMSEPENPDEGGQEASIKEYPLQFNHLAFVEKGHWDQNSPKAYEADNIILNLNKENIMPEDKVDNLQRVVGGSSTVEEKVENLENNEAQEAEKFKELSEQHQKLEDSENKNPILDEPKNLTEEVKDENQPEKAPVKNPSEPIQDESDLDTKEVKDEKDEEVIKDEAENLMDSERWSLISKFREAKDASHPNLNVKMPHIDKRLNPSAVISKILTLNSHLVNPKYNRVVDAKFDLHNYALQVDAFNDLLANIENKTSEEFTKVGKVQSGFTPTSKPHIQIDRNF